MCGSGILTRSQSATRPEIEMVEGAGAHADQHLAGAGRRIRRVFVPEHLRSAVLVKANRLQSINQTGSLPEGLRRQDEGIAQAEAG